LIGEESRISERYRVATDELGGQVTTQGEDPGFAEVEVGAARRTDSENRAGPPARHHRGDRAGNDQLGLCLARPDGSVLGEVLYEVSG
jgi:hypothetical protein